MKKVFLKHKKVEDVKTRNPIAFNCFKHSSSGEISEVRFSVNDRCLNIRRRVYFEAGEGSVQ